MAKFCKYCGTALEEDQVCTCEASQAAANPAPEAAPAADAAPAAPSGFATLMNSVKNDLLCYLRTPDTAVANAIPGGIKNAAIFAGANFLVLFFYLWKLLGGIISGMKIPVAVTYPILPLLVSALVLTALCIGLSAAALFAVAMLSKKELTFPNAIIVASYHSILPTGLLLIGILLGLISLEAQLIVLPIILIIWATFATKDAKEYAGLNASIATKNLAIQAIAVLVVVALVYWLASTLILWSFGEISYNGIALKDLVGKIDNIFKLLIK